MAEHTIQKRYNFMGILLAMNSIKE